MAAPNDDETCDVHVLRKYKLQAKLGKGAYGVVWQAVNKKTKQVVALKKIFGAFQNKTDAQRTFREVILLTEFVHDNIIRLYEVMKAMNDKDLYLVFEFMEADLHETIRAGVLSEAHNQYIMYQLLKSINYMHKARVLHRDLKPGNVLINSDCLLKVCDFGLARLYTPKPKPGEKGPSAHMMTSRDASNEVETNPNDAASLPMTENIATRWYCAPEILVGSSNYSTGVDIWAIGCILGELLAKKTIFPGNNTVHQLELILQVTGPPTRSDIESMQCPAARSLLMNIKPSRGVSLEKRLKNISPEALDLLRKLLTFNPDKRPSCAEALSHPWLKNFFDEKDLDPDVPDIHMIDNQSPTAAHYRKQLYTFIDKMAEEMAVREAKEMELRKKSREEKKKEKAKEKRASNEVKSYSEVSKANSETPSTPEPSELSKSTGSSSSSTTSSSVSSSKSKALASSGPLTGSTEKKRSTRLSFLPRKGVHKKKDKEKAIPPGPLTTPSMPTPASDVVSAPLFVKKMGHIGVDGEGNLNFSSLPPELLAALSEAPAPAPQAPPSATSSPMPIKQATVAHTHIAKSKSSDGMNNKVASGATSSRDGNKSKRISIFFGNKKEDKEKEKIPKSRSFDDLKDTL